MSDQREAVMSAFVARVAWVVWRILSAIASAAAAMGASEVAYWARLETKSESRPGRETSRQSRVG